MITCIGDSPASDNSGPVLARESGHDSRMDWWPRAGSQMYRGQRVGTTSPALERPAAAGVVRGPIGSPGRFQIYFGLAPTARVTSWPGAQRR